MDSKRNCDVMHNHSDAVEAEIGYADIRRQLEVLRATSRVGMLTSVTRIPVVVHVLYSNNQQNISDQQIFEQIAVLNEDFRALNADVSKIPGAFGHLVADALLEFGLATRDPSGRQTDGIVRQATTAPIFPVASVPAGRGPSSTIELEVKQSGLGSVAWPRDEYLNIWVCNMGKNPLGFASLPGAAAWRDGVVIDYKCFGLSGTAEAPFDKGRTTTHEVGHFLDLLHIWGGGGNSCTRSDNVSDTPNQEGPNYKDPKFPSVSCSNAPDGDLFMNYMDYVNDASMYMFTHDQVARMHSALQGPRAALLRSRGLEAPYVFSPADSLTKIVARRAYPETYEEIEDVFDGVSWVSIE